MALAHSEDAPILLRKDKDGIARLTLNRPKARNALSRGLMTALQTELDQLREQTSIRVVILSGAGPAFCAGHDLKEVRSTEDEAFFQELFAQCSKLMMSVVTLPQIVIAEVHSFAWAAGAQLVGSCDLAIAAEEATFGTPGVNIGLFCSTPMVAVSRNVPRKKMMEMLVTGDPIDAETAAEIGLINRVVPASELEREVTTLAEKIVSKSPKALRIGKEAFYRQLEMPQADAYAYASAVMTANMMEDDAREGIDAFIQKRAPNWGGI